MAWRFSTGAGSQGQLSDPYRRAPEDTFAAQQNHPMGKGDSKTKKGKRRLGSAGKSRPSKRNALRAARKKAGTAKTAVKKAAPKKAAKKAAPKKAAKKAAAKKD